MNRSVFLLVAAIFSFLIGGMSVLFPDKMAEGFGITSSPLISFLSRELGVFNLGLGVLNVLVRQEPDSKTLKAIFIFNLIYHVLMIPVNLVALTSGTFTLGQAAPALLFHLVFGAGFIFYWLRIKIAA